MAAHKTPSGVEKKRKSRKRKSRLEVSSSSESDSDVETTKKSSPSPVVEEEEAADLAPAVAASSTPKSNKKDKKKAKSTPSNDDDGDTAMTDDIPGQATTKAAPSQSQAQSQDDFNAIYLRKITTELADDLDKVREAQDFKASSVPMLIHALKQGESLFSAEEKRRIVSAVGK
ncbi:Nn.00g048420.m01.CDS01 [Neocucurbitaria sp. VM-36]